MRAGERGDEPGRRFGIASSRHRLADLPQPLAVQVGQARGDVRVVPRGRRGVDLEQPHVPAFGVEEQPHRGLGSRDRTGERGPVVAVGELPADDLDQELALGAEVSVQRALGQIRPDAMSFIDTAL
ncbi:hypothetical protein ACQP1W_30715 [Spirillospora sp. CA-255316]